ncbi:MAG: Lrp/AsnC family transcriptional regulator [Rhodobacter sp.]|nr:Lrp/AsnC family transcriptional regulator [Rhodobacter sp.]
MDSLDQKLVAALRRDARMSLSDLAGHLGITRATVRSRIERLLARGDILGFTVITRADMTHSPVRGLMMLKIEGAGTERIVHRLTGFPEVQQVHSTNGTWDLIAEIGTETLEALDRILFEIRRLDGITSSETHLLLSTRKSARTR